MIPTATTEMLNQPQKDPAIPMPGAQTAREPVDLEALRDQLAIAALGGILAAGRESLLKNPEELGRLCWAFADVVIKQRDNK